MLAQSFKSSPDLGITEIERASLVSFLGMIERGELVMRRDAVSDAQNSIYMETYIARGRESECGTVACICGWAHKISGGIAFPEVVDRDAANVTDLLIERLNKPTLDLFYIATDYNHPQSVDQIARALRNYLTTGSANWPAVLLTKG